tara:strand:- start:142 stop:732 length:591 start_codon:yes stop_codon:yes gene_type:complete
MAKSKKQAFDKDAFLNKAFEVIESKGYQSLSPDLILKDMGISAKDIPFSLSSKEDVMVLFEEHITDQLIQIAPELFDGSETTKEKLFELMMERFDLMEPYKTGLHEIFKTLPMNPILVLKSIPHFRDMVRSILQLADIDISCPTSEIKIIGFTYIYLRSCKNWFEDESVDKGKTMAALDKHLTFAEQIANSLFKFG